MSPEYLSFSAFDPAKDVLQAGEQMVIWPDDYERGAERGSSTNHDSAMHCSAGTRPLFGERAVS